MNSGSSQATGSTSQSLIRRAQRNEADAWRRLSNLYVPLVYGWVRRAQLQPSEAADIVQEVFQSLLTNIGQFHDSGPNATFRGWLWTITRNQIRLHHRRQSKRPEVTGGTDHHEQIEQLPDLLTQEDELTTSGAKKSLLHRALQIVRGDFEERTWQAFWRLTVDRHSAAEIAAELQMNPKSVRQAKYRVLSRLRQELSDS